MSTVPQIASLKVWTLEQQQQELGRRLAVFGKSGQSMPPFTPREDDVVCAVSHKSGTTWLMHICHQIRMKGAEPDFEDQFHVICWIEWNKIFLGVDPDVVVQPASPRLFVTHLTTYDEIPKAKRMIFMFRDQLDVLYSLYRMLDSMLLLRGRASLSVFANIFVRSGNVQQKFEDLVGWWEKRHDENVLFLFYDDLKEDHVGSVRKIANLMGVECDDEVIARVVRTTSHAEMCKHSSKFSSRSFVQAITKQIGDGEPDFESDSYVGRVRKDGGKSGDGKAQLPPEICEYINQMWHDTVTTKLGFKDLKEMRQAWLKELEEAKTTC